MYIADTTRTLVLYTLHNTIPKNHADHEHNRDKQLVRHEQLRI